MNQNLRNYEIVSVSALSRVLITVDREELRDEWPARIQSARIEEGHLVLACEGPEGQPYNLSLLDFPENEISKLTSHRTSLCGLENGRVEYVQAFPATAKTPSPSRGGP